MAGIPLKFVLRELERRGNVCFSDDKAIRDVFFKITQKLVKDLFDSLHDLALLEQDRRTEHIAKPMKLKADVRKMRDYAEKIAFIIRDIEHAVNNNTIYK